jgi:hypothetical protein
VATSVLLRFQRVEVLQTGAELFVGKLEQVCTGLLEDEVTIGGGIQRGGGGQHVVHAAGQHTTSINTPIPTPIQESAIISPAAQAIDE